MDTLRQDSPAKNCGHGKGNTQEIDVQLEMSVAIDVAKDDIQ